MELGRRGTTIDVALEYPRVEGNVSHVEIDLVDVRAADRLRVSYDFERDGWVVEQPRGDWVDEAEWVEMGFFAAWALEPDRGAS